MSTEAWKESGRIHLVRGPMFASKTTRLYEIADRKERVYGKERVMYINYGHDTRYSEDARIKAHNGLHKPSVPAVGKLKERCTADPEFAAQIKRAYVVVIDEGQFFPDIAEFADELSGMGKLVVVGALDMDFEFYPFFNIQTLAVFAQEETRLTAVCMQCKSDKAIFSCLMTNDDENTKGNEIIGGPEKYEPRCRHCVSDYRKGDLKNMFKRERDEELS